MENVEKFNQILKSFHIKADCVNYENIENYSFYDVELNPDGRIRELHKFSEEIGLALKARAKPLIKVLPEQGLVRVEFVSPRKEKLNLIDCFTNNSLPKGELLCLLGQDLYGHPVWMNLDRNPHMIVAGTTGSGKSTLLHNIIANLFNYNDAKIYLMDPKNIEFSKYSNIIENISYNYTDSVYFLDELIATMELRYQMIRDGLSPARLPYYVVIIDEFADLIMQDKNDEFYTKLCRLAQKCRASKIHLILSTQRPSASIVDGNIKANFPARIACKVSSSVDSRIILDSSGAENLMGRGDAILKDDSRSLERFQVAYIDADEVIKYFGDRKAS